MDVSWGEEMWCLVLGVRGTRQVNAQIQQNGQEFGQKCFRAPR